MAIAGASSRASTSNTASSAQGRPPINRRNGNGVRIIKA